MNILIIGADGYLGWPLTMRMSALGHDVIGIDNYSRRQKAQSVTPIGTPKSRLIEWQSARRPRHRVDMIKGDVRDCHQLIEIVQRFTPDAIVHLGEQPSAPYSMSSMNACIHTAHNNVIGTLTLLWAMREYCPNAHLVKLGSMGEYGTPGIDITEGRIPITIRGRTDTLPFPKQPGSFYHSTKCADSLNVELACRCWGFTSTDIMQGVVYGTRTDEIDDDELLTRFDVDETWGTVINRFCAQAVLEEPITPYGTGGQVRGFLPLRDSIQCLQLVIENPPFIDGTYRVINQFDRSYSIHSLAEHVQAAARRAHLGPLVRHVDNPRVEHELHYYNPDHQILRDLGYCPHADLDGELDTMIGDLVRFRKRIPVELIDPRTRWR